MVQLDLDESLESQGPFDVIIHKLTDQIARSQSGSRDAQHNIDRFQVRTDIIVLLVCRHCSFGRFGFSILTQFV